MDLKPVTYGAMTGAGITLLVLAGIQVRDMMRAKAQAESERPTGVLAPAVGELRSRLTAYATEKATEIATGTAEQVLGQVYGFTPARIAAFQRVSSRLGA